MTNSFFSAQSATVTECYTEPEKNVEFLRRRALIRSGYSELAKHLYMYLSRVGKLSQMGHEMRYKGGAIEWRCAEMKIRIKLST